MIDLCPCPTCTDPAAAVRADLATLPERAACDRCGWRGPVGMLTRRDGRWLCDGCEEEWRGDAPDYDHESLRREER